MDQGLPICEKGLLLISSDFETYRLEMQGSWLVVEILNRVSSRLELESLFQSEQPLLVQKGGEQAVLTSSEIKLLIF